jgi:gamma-glutamyl:cysteine ligase YbdK (ATP-grasp superfamily)
MACRDTIANVAVEHADELGYVVQSRVNSAIDLVVAEAKHHGNCYAFEKLFSCLRENDEFQYSVDVLLRKVTEYLPESAELCTEMILKKTTQRTFS